MALYEMTRETLRRIETTTLGNQGFKERADLQRLLRQQVEIVAPGTMVIAEEFGDWEESRRRIDLLALDRDANLVVIELKRTEDGGHLELQAIRYAAMVSTMTFDQVVDAHAAYRAKYGQEEEGARAAILEFLGWMEPNEPEFAQDVRIVLVSGDFSKEITTAVMWLNQKGLDIRCVPLQVYALEGRVLVDVRQSIPLPEATDYQVRVRAKQAQQRAASESRRDYTKFDVTIGEVTRPRLAKRHAIFAAVSSLCATGVSPAEISRTLEQDHGTWWGQPENLWYWVDGEVDAATFRERATASSRRFDRRRWFCEDAELIQYDGRTWAFLNQWGPSTRKVLDSLVKAFPEARLAYTAVEG
ncbi:MAG: hypothetical protein ACK47B_18865 [Armatimonadota bacterium]